MNLLGTLIDSLVSAFSPQTAVRRQHARRVMRTYAGAESNRLNAHKNPRNLAADTELAGPFGADSLRAWSRQLVRDNAYAWGVVDTIVSSVVGNGITAQSMFETDGGEDVEAINLQRDSRWSTWCELCDINGQYTFTEMQRMAQREIVEAGEVLIHMIPTPRKEYRGVSRPVPLALELVEADRLAAEKDTYTIARDGGKRIVRGVELDDMGKPVAYWIYRDHPNAPYAWNRTPERVPANRILHLFRRDRIGQSRGVSWFAPVVSWLRDLGIYVDNELQASAVSSCFGVAIKTDTPPGGLMPDSGDDTTDDRGNQYQFLEPGQVMYLNPGESVDDFNPSRPNSGSEPWIALMLRGIAVGTGLSYEVVARDYSKTNYSSSRTSQLEDRRRFRVWQQYLLNHMCQPIWDRFCEQAALAGDPAFPTTAELLEDRRRFAAVEWQTPTWEWVDPQNEQQASQSSIEALQSTYQDELGKRGYNWRKVFRQRAKEQRLMGELGLMPLSEQEVAAKASPEAGSDLPELQATGEMASTSTLQFRRNRKAIRETLEDFKDGLASETETRATLSMIGLAAATIDALIADAKGEETDEPEMQEAANA